MQLGLSSSIASDTVVLTNFVKNFNFSGGLYSNSLVNLFYVLSLIAADKSPATSQMKLTRL